MFKMIYVGSWTVFLLGEKNFEEIPFEIYVALPLFLYDHETASLSETICYLEQELLMLSDVQAVVCVMWFQCNPSCFS